MREALGDRRDIARVVNWRLDEPPYFIQREYVPGGNLAEWAQKHGGIGNVPLSERLRIIVQIAAALSAAHSVGILHKDIKPANVMMAQDGDGEVYPRLTDFGIGALTDSSRLPSAGVDGSGLTTATLSADDSSQSGSRIYVPPEVLAGQPYTVQGDVYALGLLLYQVVVGDLRRPLGIGWDRQVDDELLREDIAACVDEDPARRLSSAGELGDLLRNLEARRTARRQKLKQEQTARLAPPADPGPGPGRSVKFAVGHRRRHRPALARCNSAAANRGKCRSRGEKAARRGREGRQRRPPRAGSVSRERRLGPLQPGRRRRRIAGIYRGPAPRTKHRQSDSRRGDSAGVRRGCAIRHGSPRSPQSSAAREPTAAIESPALASHQEPVAHRPSHTGSMTKPLR